MEGSGGGGIGKERGEELRRGGVFGGDSSLLLFLVWRCRMNAMKERRQRGSISVIAVSNGSRGVCCVFGVGRRRL
eukprot:scaffold25615_cov45-Cyclotella_meneghiniana.AAC.6